MISINNKFLFTFAFAIWISPLMSGYYYMIYNLSIEVLK